MTATLGQLLTQWRSQRKMTLREVGRQAGIAHSTLGRWEKGAFLPRLPELEAVLKVLGATEAQRRQALNLLNMPRVIAYKRQETTQSAPDFVKAAGGVPGEGLLLRAMRLRAGKTLEQTAQSIGVTAGTLSRWEHSEIRPDTSHLHSLCYALGAGEEEMIALTCEGSVGKLLPHSESLEQLSMLARDLQAGFWNPSVALRDLIFTALEAQAWDLLPRQAEAQNLVFAINYWQMQNTANTGRDRQARPYLQRVVGLTATMPRLVPLPVSDNQTHLFDTQEAHNRAVIYQAILTPSDNPAANRRRAQRLARHFRNAYNDYFQAWMMSEAAKLLIKAGNIQTALEWSFQASKVANSGDDWTETLFRKRDYATLLVTLGRSEEALTMVDSTESLNARHPYCQARYHMQRTEIHLSLNRTAQAHENLMAARKMAQTPQLNYLLPDVESLESRF